MATDESRPATSVAVVVPWFDSGCEHRRRALGYTTDYWRTRFPEAEVVLGAHAGAVGEATFSRAAAANAAIRGCSADVILRADAETVVPVRQARAAARFAAAGDGVFVGHSEHTFLSHAETERLLAGAWDPDWPFVGREAEWTGHGGMGGVVAFSRRTWEAVGGYDESIVGWGGDDASLAYPARALVGPGGRVSGPLFHLWHPRPAASSPEEPGYSRNFAIVAGYRDAADDPDAMRRILEARA